MKTVGSFLKEARLNKSYSKAHLEGKTKIKNEFLEAIESEDWSKLPEYAVVRGFVKSIADALDQDADQALALLRRDYPPQKVVVNPKPDVDTKFIWTPKLTFLTGTALVLVVVLGYLTLQYLKFINPPVLEIYKPTDAQIVSTANLEVSGKTDQGATVKINNQPALVSDVGEFKTEIEVNESTKQIEVVSTSRGGKETRISRSIKVEFK
jgi:cytoskeletal protein RodZ